MGHAHVTVHQFSAAVSGRPNFPEESDELSEFLRYETLPFSPWTTNIHKPGRRSPEPQYVQRRRNPETD